VLSVVGLVATVERSYNASLQEVIAIVNNLCLLIGGGIIGAEVCSSSLSLSLLCLVHGGDGATTRLTFNNVLYDGDSASS
jgi:hypothetical protein